VDDAEIGWPIAGANFEAEVKEVMGLFDLPAFARRGQDLQLALSRLHERCRAARGSMLDMVRLRLRQWAAAVTGPASWSSVLAGSIEPLWPLAQAAPPHWANSSAPIHRQRQVARDLIDSVLRFNRRWTHYLDHLNLAPTNLVIEEYNRYYLIEKECVMGSPRLASRYFTTIPTVTTQMLHRDHPILPVPVLLEPRSRFGRASPAR
jgi:hypothetical protein